jgi:hypothetical protein
VEQRSLVALILKTAGLLLIINTLIWLPDRVAGYMFGAERSPYLFVGLVLLPLAVPLIAGALLFWFPATVAGAVSGPQPAPGSDLERMLQAVIFAGIGLWVTLQGVLDVAYYVALHTYVQDEFAARPLDDPVNRAGLISSVLSLILGVVLLLSARGLSALIARIRYGS